MRGQWRRRGGDGWDGIGGHHKKKTFDYLDQSHKKKGNSINMATMYVFYKNLTS